MVDSSSEAGSLTRAREGSGPRSWAESTWHTTQVNKYPSSQAVFEDVQSCIRDYIQPGYLPDGAVCTPEKEVVTIGSCFAAELRHFLSEVGLSSSSFWVPSGLNNTFALRDFLSWVVTGEESSKGYRYERGADGEIEDWAPEEERSLYRQRFTEASVFVFTLGLAEVWEDKQTGKVFWRGIPESVYEEGRHEFRVSSVEENTQNLERMVELLRQINPDASVVFTLSPVPLKATFRSTSCMIADSVSKSTLRVALHNVCEMKLERVYYWPSFEIVKWLGPHLPYPVYGTDDGVTRHVSRYLVLHILRAFTSVFYGEEAASRYFDTFQSTLPREEGVPGQPPIIYRGTIVKA